MNRIGSGRPGGLALAALATCLWASCVSVLGADAGGAGRGDPAMQRGDVAARGREVMSRWEKAVVGVKLTTKMRMAHEGRQYHEEESTQEIRATVVDPSGLAICALSEADPTQMYASFMEEEAGDKWDVEITSVKLRLADGKEIPAKIVLRDKDLDVAVVRPTEKPATPLAAVDLADAAKASVLEQVVVLGRLGEVANRAPIATLDRIAGIMERPRLFYVPGPDGQSISLGCPVFTLDGKVVGVLVARMLTSPGGPVSDEDMDMLTVILPAADALEVAKQAPAAG